MSDPDAVKLWDVIFFGQDGDQPAQGVAVAFFTTAFGPNGFEKPAASDKGLQEIIDNLYQDTDQVPGGTAGAARYEAATGKLLSKKGHWQDCTDTAREISYYLKANPGLSTYDQSLAKSLIEDLTSAAATKP